jgi:hypothetical protein
MDLFTHNVNSHHSANYRYQSTQQNKNIIKRSILINFICVFIVGLNQVEGSQAKQIKLFKPVLFKGLRFSQSQLTVSVWNSQLIPILATTGVDGSTHQ